MISEVLKTESELSKETALLKHCTELTTRVCVCVCMCVCVFVCVCVCVCMCKVKDS
jgi:hypothetical protein